MIRKYIRYVILTIFVIVVLVLICSDFVIAENAKEELEVVTVGERHSDSSKRLIRSAGIYGFTLQVLGNNDGRISDKLRLHLLRGYLKELAVGQPKKVVLYIEGPSALITAGPLRVVEEWERSGGGIVVSADGVCWPDRTLQSQYPKIDLGRRFINAGGFVGTAEDLSGLLEEAAEDTDSLQVLLTKSFLKKSTKEKFNINIDSNSNLFQNLHGATGDIELRFAGKEAYLQNIAYNTVPVVIRGNEGTDRTLNNLGAYLARSWTIPDGCRSCWDDMMILDGSKESEMPIVMLAIFIEKPTPFTEEFFNKIDNLIYPRKRIHLYLHNDAAYHDVEVSEWYEGVKDQFNSTKYIGSKQKLKEWHAKNEAMAECTNKDCRFLFMIDSEAHLDNPHVIKLLVQQNRTVVAPMLTRPHKAWSNFWGELTSEGFYARSMDYMEIVQNQRRGLWNVPYISSCMLLRRDLIDTIKPTFINNLLDPDMAFCQNLRDKGVFMYVSNRVDLGHLVSAEGFNTEVKNPELWQIIENRWDWEARYLHENYTQSLAENSTIAMPCTDVYWFPLFNERYTQSLIDTVESYGDWSSGGHDDARLDGGYESVPTVDVHMKQIGYEDEWLELLKEYVQPLQQRVFDGYFNEVGPPRAIMNFVVRYKPDEQPLLRPHHDTSTYSINVALNRAGIDFEGGGTRFIRYNCSVVSTRVGWLLMHPGRLTHLHEGLTVTKGTRYITVSFIDP